MMLGIMQMFNVIRSKIDYPRMLLWTVLLSMCIGDGRSTELVRLFVGASAIVWASKRLPGGKIHPAAACALIWTGAFLLMIWPIHQMVQVGLVGQTHQIICYVAAFACGLAAAAEAAHGRRKQRAAGPIPAPAPALAVHFN